MEEQVNEDWIKKIFQQLQQSDLYKTYIKKKDRELKYDKKIMLFIWEQLMLKDEALLEHFSDELNGWDDDKDMIFMLVENFFKHNSTYNYLQLVSEEKLEYAQNLIRAVIEKDIKRLMETQLKDRGFVIESVLLKSINLPTGLRRAIEEKLEAEQDAQRMEFTLNKERQEATRKIIEAEGVRNAQKIISEGLTPMLLRYKTIEAFNKLATSPNTKVVITNGDQPLMVNSESIK